MANLVVLFLAPCCFQSAILHAQVLGMPLEMHNLGDALVVRVEEIRSGLLLTLVLPSCTLGLG